MDSWRYMWQGGSHMRETNGLMTHIFEVQLGPQLSPSHLACYHLVSEQKRCVRLPNLAAHFSPGWAYSSPLSPLHTHTHTHTLPHIHTETHTTKRCEPVQLRSVWSALQWTAPSCPMVPVDFNWHITWSYGKEGHTDMDSDKKISPSGFTWAQSPWK